MLQLMIKTYLVGDVFFSFHLSFNMAIMHEYILTIVNLKALQCVWPNFRCLWKNFVPTSGLRFGGASYTRV